MKKIIAVLLVAALVFALSACRNLRKIKSVISEITDGEVLDGDGMIKDDSDWREEDSSRKESSKPEPKSEYTISNEVLVDNEHITVTVVEAYESDFGDFVLKILVENKSDINISINNDTGDVSYNGYMIYSWWSSEVSAGKKANSEMIIYSEDIKMSDLGVAEEVTFKLAAYTEDSYDSRADEYFSVYPTGLDADSVTYPDRAPVAGETVIVDNEDLKFTIERVNHDESWAYELQFYVENKTDDAMYITWNDQSINGFMVSSYWNKTVFSGMKSVSIARFFNEELEKNDIADVEEIEFELKAYKGNYSGDVIFEDTFVYYP